MPVLRCCRTCRMFKVLGEEHFDRSTRPGGAWMATCRACLAGRPPETAEARDELTRREQAVGVLELIRRYEAVRGTPGRDREAAYNVLALALKRHHMPVSDGERQWAWDSGLGEITTRLIRRSWRPPEDRHANPVRLARGDGEFPITELVEM